VWNLFSGVFGGLVGVFEGVLSWFGLSTQSISSFFVHMKEGIVGAWQDLLGWLDPVLKYLKEVYGWYKNIFGGVVGKIAGALGFGGEQVKSVEQNKDLSNSPPAPAVPTLESLKKPQNAPQALPNLAFDYASLNPQNSAPITKTDSRSINSNNTQTINIYTQSDPQSIVGAIKQSSIGQYSYADED
uniref:hypothetical protein n=1 Tax=Helicobacter bizzozeronii TaxID=56877 RepID=UPI0013156788